MPHSPQRGRKDPAFIIGGILFADVVGFFGLPDVEFPRFFDHFLPRVRDVLAATGADRHALHRNTWGDGLFCVFDDVRVTGLAALALCDMMQETDWRHLGLSRPLELRVAVHVGPLYHFVDPVTQQHTYSGKHVARSARIEPVTPPGCVYASQEFAAMSMAEGITEFRCEAVGRMQLAKDAGPARLFVLHPTVAAGRGPSSHGPRGRPAKGQQR